MIHAEEARKRAALIISRIKAGEEAVPEPMKPSVGPSVAELAARYLTEYVEVRCKPRTVKVARSVVRKHIAPALGRLPLAAVERAHVAELHQRLCGTPAAANQAVRTLSADVPPGRSLGSDPAWPQPVPGGAPLPDATV